MDVAVSPALGSLGRRPRKPPAEQVSGRFFLCIPKSGNHWTRSAETAKKRSYCLDSFTAAKKQKPKVGIK